MSGPKRGYISPTPASLVAYARAELERAVLAADSDEQQGPAGVERWLVELRGEAERWRIEIEKMTHDPKGDFLRRLLQELEKKREDLELTIAQKKQDIRDRYDATKKDAAAIMDQANAVLSGRNVSAASSSDVESKLRRVTAELKRFHKSAEGSMRRLERQRLELQSLKDQVTTALNPAARSNRGSTTGAAVSAVESIAKAAALAAIKETEGRLTAAKAAPPGGWDEFYRWAGNESPAPDLRGRLDAAERLLGQGDAAGAGQALDEFEAMRETLQQRAEKNRLAADRLRTVADAVMQALCDRHYNTPVFGSLRDGDPLSGIQIRADVPNKDGRGNIRVDLHLDGRAVFEVENVPEGEERLCRSLIDGLGEAVSSEGMEFEVTDWGRARAASKDDALHARQRQEITRERESESGKVDDRGGHR